MFGGFDDFGGDVTVGAAIGVEEAQAKGRSMRLRARLRSRTILLEHLIVDGIGRCWWSWRPCSSSMTSTPAVEGGHNTASSRLST